MTNKELEDYCLTLLTVTRIISEAYKTKVTDGTINIMLQDVDVSDFGVLLNKLHTYDKELYKVLPILSKKMTINLLELRKRGIEKELQEMTGGGPSLG